MRGEKPRTYPAVGKKTDRHRTTSEGIEFPLPADLDRKFEEEHQKLLEKIRALRKPPTVTVEKRAVGCSGVTRKLVIKLPMFDEPWLSRSGKSHLIACSRGLKKTAFRVEGYPVYVSVVALIFGYGDPNDAPLDYDDYYSLLGDDARKPCKNESEDEDDDMDETTDADTPELA